ncbi:DUF4476 domain-containing protein [Ferruginibacter sp. HRS2-29]|uniref:DUF4476 domain-containing protein n=1 Tax=Ferruginibacter sp. HRS2-29 TaxID=2487334 RepID=UPI0020CEDC37|nr:DUF4476 domain-containing protein [Ferruginibacter sp. HRS2-29]MCP9751916.1 DUF4476 domain-containing protein [Ferruginibacter sp. HRS2-29]
MKILLLAVSLIFSSVCAFSQHNHFVYVQSDNKQPFYVRLNDKVYSSSASGYAIISKLQKGDYVLSVGFPKNEFPQQSISINVSGDAGYMLKNFGDKGWGLYNIQTMAVNMASGGTAGSGTAATTQPKDDGFSNTLSGVVKTPVQVVTPAKDSQLTVQPTPVTEVKLVTEPVKTAVVENAGSIKMLNSTKDNSGRSAVYIDNIAGANDTVRIFIPAVTKAVIPVKEPVKEVVKEDKKFLDIELVNPNAKVDSVKEVIAEPVKTTVVATTPAASNPQPANPQPVTVAPVTTPTKPLTINSDCRSLASDDDFFKIRKKMAAEDKEDDMIAAAKKMFKSKCYSTEQVKNLSVLFLKDKDKYNFFDAAYPFIHDTQNFSSLEKQLSDPYYITRFKAMIRN